MMMNWDKLLNPIRSGQSKASEAQERSPFDRDYDRIIFSHAFRRLQDKTQVFPLPEDAFVHTRLTHSLEVSSVARSLGRIAGKTLIQRHKEIVNLGFSELDIGTITASAALAHDIGNPPFGHSGEQVISEFFLRNSEGQFFQSLVTEDQWADLTNFEGNAQGFRLLNGKSYNITLPVLGAFTKYPRPSRGTFPVGNRSYKKFGFFRTEEKYFDEMSETLEMKGDNGLTLRHPLAFLVEAADDICYHIIDLEDGAALGLVSYEEATQLLKPLIPDNFSWEKFKGLSSWSEKIGVLRAVAINRLISESVELFLENEESILKGEYTEALVDQISLNQDLEEIIKISVQKLYRAKVVNEIEAAGFRVLEGLLESLMPAFYKISKNSSPGTKDKILYRLIPDHFKSVVKDEKLDDYGIIRQLLDYISGLPDRYAISLYKKIFGIELPRL